MELYSGSVECATVLNFGKPWSSFYSGMEFRLQKVAVLALMY